MDSFRLLCDEFQLINGTLSLCTDLPLRTVRTTRNIEKGETIIQVPQKYFINSRSKLIKQKSLLLKYLKEVKQLYKANKKIFQSLDDRESLSLLFDLLKDQNSDFHEGCIYLIQCKFMFSMLKDYPKKQVEFIHHHYIKLLPQNYSYHPICFGLELQDFYPETHNILQKNQKKIEIVAQTLRKIIQNTYNFEPSFRQFLYQEGFPHLYERYIQTITLQNIRWAYLVLQTRQFSGNNLVPILDLFNHSSTKTNASWKFHSETGVSLCAKCAIKKGKQILVCYNENISQTNYMVYGFMEDEGRLGVSIPMDGGISQIEIVSEIGWNKFPQQVASQLKNFFLLDQSKQAQKRIKYFRNKFIEKCSKHLSMSLQRIQAIERQIRKGVKDKPKLANLKILKKINEKEKIIYAIIVKQAERMISKLKKNIPKKEK